MKWLGYIKNGLVDDLKLSIKITTQYQRFLKKLVSNNSNRESCLKMI
ncbi:unnamed protein product (macronuclear) [Paramecium tetraurelia]|uniref:Uncharacterized protein n=1 Tax=Paramecium tetraurelia TaxID=5888 RepID=A0CW40_PARTE|nr:uncharacterized protein GSPATT00001209001 [Paramecium tetraurelia]CAK75007.1 unnamed protein product [Paramecium tetraurelia]|eukprot:XP_001442404.1 hypothetical protein (macronuclear) [Paramecium tetraurelia strain d4-2]